MQLGKPTPKTMASTIWRFTGAKSRAVIVGPTPGVDVAVLDIGGGRVLVANSDPVSLIPSMGPEDSASLSRYWRAIHKTCLQLGVSILGGHTGRFEGCDYSIIGGATMWTTCRKDEFLTSSMAGDGDDLIFTKSAAYGATSVRARSFPKTVRKHLGQSLV